MEPTENCTAISNSITVIPLLHSSKTNKNPFQHHIYIYINVSSSRLYPNFNFPSKFEFPKEIKNFFPPSRIKFPLVTREIGAFPRDHDADNNVRGIPHCWRDRNPLTGIQVLADRAAISVPRPVFPALSREKEATLT